MNKAIITASCVALLYAQAAEARKMSMMEWMDPKSMSIWRGLSDDDKSAAIHDFLTESQGGMGDEANSKTLAAKVRQCLDKEVADPEYKGKKVPLMIPMSYCVTKYMTIMDAQ